MRHARTRSLLLLVPVAAMSLAACGDGAKGSGYGASNSSNTTAPGTTGADTTADTTSAGTTAAGTTAVGAGTAATGVTTLQLADSSLGKILVDRDGNTLYLFAKDAPNAPACDTGCLGTWSALTNDGAATVGEGLGLDDVGTVTAADGSTQVTFYGHPLYRFAGDAAPGDVNGQGIGGVWHVIDAEGNAVK